MVGERKREREREREEKSAEKEKKNSMDELWDLVICKWIYFCLGSPINGKRANLPFWNKNTDVIILRQKERKREREKERERERKKEREKEGMRRALCVLKGQTLEFRLL